MPSAHSGLTESDEMTSDIVDSVLLATRFTQDDALSAYNDWGANSGPGAIAAIAGISLAEVRPHMGDFEAKRYTSPALMWEVLRSLGLRWRMQRRAPGGLALPSHGLARIQWEGPWTEPGAPIKARYRHTHWIAAVGPGTHAFVFDINCMATGGWVPLKTWSKSVVPWLLEQYVAPKATGRWHITHAVEVDWVSSISNQEAQQKAMGCRIQR